MSNPSLPPAAPKSNTSTILIVVVAVVALCCLCTAVAGAGGAALFLYNTSSTSGMRTTLEAIPQVVTEEVFPAEPTWTEEVATPEVETPEPTETAEPTETPEPTETAAAPQTSGPGMGVSRDEMMKFFNAGNAFTWADPIMVSGVEMVQGTHSSLCVKSDCASVTLAGPADDLLAVSVAVPLSPTDNSERLTAITLLMTAVGRFNDQKGLNTLPKQILNDMGSASKAGTSLDKSFENNGYKFTESYNPKTQVGAIGITRPK